MSNSNLHVCWLFFPSLKCLFHFSLDIQWHCWLTVWTSMHDVFLLECSYLTFSLTSSSHSICPLQLSCFSTCKFASSLYLSLHCFCVVSFITWPSNFLHIFIPLSDLTYCSALALSFFGVFPTLRLFYQIPIRIWLLRNTLPMLVMWLLESGMVRK